MQGHVSKRFCGSEAPQYSDVVTTNINKLRVKFRSDGTVTGSGFGLNYTTCRYIINIVRFDTIEFHIYLFE